MTERAMGGYLAAGPLAVAWPEGTAVLRCLMLWALVCGAAGLWLLLPVRRRWGRSVGGALCAVAGLLAALDLPSLGSAGPDILFWFLAAVTLGAAIATISAQHPVYAAIWFALSLLGTSGLMLLQGAQFLGVATVVVYAGAIVVTFLFVLMLAQPSGEASYDRTSWGGLPKALAIVAAGAWIGLLTLLLGDLRQAASQPATAAEVSTQAGPTAATAASPPTRAAALAAPGGILTESHMAVLGQRLFSKHLLSVELAGTLLLVALVGAVAAALPGRPRLEEQIEEALR
jgi:NADH-quinone oxidoreductase subunit J